MGRTKHDPWRRRFVNWLFGTSVTGLFAAVVYPIFRFLSPPVIPEATTAEVEAGPVNDPELIERGYKIIRFGAEPVIIIRLADNEFRAFAATCTHLDCVVEYQRAEGRIWCNCRSGEYDLAGRNVNGPPPKPLTQFQVHVVTQRGQQPGNLVVSRS